MRQRELLTETEKILSELPESVKRRVQEIFDGYLKISGEGTGYELGEGEVVLPENLSALTSQEMGELQGRYAGWYAYYVDRVKFLRVAVQVLEEEVRTELARGFTRLEGKMTVDMKRMMAELGEGYQVLRYHLVRVKGLVDLLDEDLKKTDKILSVLSREISRREVTAGF